MNRQVAATGCAVGLLAAFCLGGDVPVELVERGFASAEAVAVSPRGDPAVGMGRLGGAIATVLGGGRAQVLAETSGRPAGLAYDATGELYVADSELAALFRVTPWGQVSVVAENLMEPAGVTVGADGAVYVTDRKASRVYRISPRGEMTGFGGEIAAPRGIVAATETGEVFVSERAGKIWRFSPDGSKRTQFAVLADEGEPAGMALDEAGNLYVARDGGGKVSVLSAEGKLIGAYEVPGRRVTGVAFGGYELATLFITEAEGGALYKVRLPRRSQRLLWEPAGTPRITWPPGGTIVNRHDGEKAGDGIRIPVRGVCRGAASVRVNGVAAQVKDGQFEASVVLRERESRVVAEAGADRHAVTVLWDRDSFPRYRFSTDDNIWCLRDIAKNAGTYKSIFDNPYMAFWREMHRKYGTKIHHNIYYETAGFDLSEMPDKFRAEWQQNAGWLRLSFHARANNPAQPYLQASAEEMRRDYRLVTREIERFAGKEMLSPVTTIHWAVATRAAARALREEGVRVLLGVAPFREDLPYGGYYLTVPQLGWALGRDYWKDTEEDILYVRHDIVINNVELDKIAGHLERVASNPRESEVMELMIHEQYFYPEYRAYEADYRERVERAIEWVTRRGYRPVFFGEGFLGATPRQ